MKNFNDIQQARKRRRLDREGTCINITSTPEYSEQSLDSVLRDIQRHLKICFSAAENQRQKTLSILRIAKQYKEQMPCLFSSIMAHLEAFLPTGPSAEDKNVFELVENSNSEEKADPALTRAYMLTLQPTQQNLDEAEKLLLSILPDSVGGTVLDYYCWEMSNGSIKYYDVEHSMELLFVKEMLHLSQKNETPFVAKAAPVSHHAAIHLYVYLLIEKKQYEKALEVCQVAMKRNPLFVHCLFECGEIHKMLKQPENLLQETMNCFVRCYKQRDLAKCYRNFGFYFIEKREFEYAMACFLKSLEYECHCMVKNELLYIQHRIPQNDPLYTPITNIVNNLRSLENNQQANHNQAHANTPLASMTTQTISLPKEVATYVASVLEKAQIPTTPNSLFLQVSHQVAVTYKSSRRFLEACCVAYGITQSSSYLAYMRLYLNGVEICGQKLSNVPKSQTASNASPVEEATICTISLQAETCESGAISPREEEASLRPIPQQQETKL